MSCNVCFKPGRIQLPTGDGDEHRATTACLPVAKKMPLQDMTADDLPTLVVGPAWVGDMIMAQTLMKRLVHDRPTSRIHLVAPRSTLPLADFMPEVSSAWLLDAGHGQLALGSRWRLARKLALHNFSRAYVLPNTFKSALLPWMAGVPQRTGWMGEMRYWLLNDRRVLDRHIWPRLIDRYLALADSTLSVTCSGPPLLPRLSTDTASVAATLKRFDLDPEVPVAALCPGADFGPAKRWPAEHFRELAEKLWLEGFQVWVLGGPRDQEAGALISAQSAQVENLTGRTSLPEAVELLSVAAVAVCNDTGLMHAAAALGLPVVVIYGSSSSDFTPPLTDRQVSLMLQLPCRPCFERVCPLGHTRCLNDIPAERALAAVRSIIGKVESR